MRCAEECGECGENDFFFELLSKGSFLNKEVFFVKRLLKMFFLVVWEVGAKLGWFLKEKDVTEMPAFLCFADLWADFLSPVFFFEAFATLQVRRSWMKKMALLCCWPLPSRSAN